MCDPPEGQAGALEITPAMIEAGVLAAREHTLGEGLEKLVGDIYIAMAIERDAERHQQQQGKKVSS